MLISSRATMATALNKLAPDPPPARWFLTLSATDLGAWCSWWGRCGGGSDPALDFASPVPPSRRRVLWRRRGTSEIVQECAVRPRRRQRVLAVVDLGDLDGAFAMVVFGCCFLWSWLCGRLASGSGGSLRLRRGRGAGSGGVRGFPLAKISNVDLWRTEKAAAMVLLQAVVCSPVLAGASAASRKVGGCTGALRDRIVNSVCLRVVCVKFQGEVVLRNHRECVCVACTDPFCYL